MRKRPFQGKSQLSISDLAVRRHPCTRGATTVLPAPTTVLHDRPLRHARPSPPSCPNGPLRHARPDRASQVACRTRLQKNRPTWPPTCKRGTLLAENRHSPLRVYTQKHPKRRFRVNAARPVRPDLMPPSCPTRSGISQIMEYTDKGSAEALPEARRTEEDHPIGY